MLEISRKKRLHGSGKLIANVISVNGAREHAAR
jgi:hypothetical protein